MFGDWRPRAVVFDCDGLLVDTEGCWTQAEAAMCAARGVGFSAADERALLGVSVPDVARLLADRIGPGATPAAVEDELVGLVTEIVAREAQPMRGAVSLIGLVHARVPVAVASNSPRPLLDQALGRGRFAAGLDATVAADEVARPKPAPDLYLAACARLGAAPRDALALEDSATGVRAATAAGLRALGVPTVAGASIGADATVASLADPALVAWVAGWTLR